MFSWGENTHGQLGMGDVSSRGKPQPIESLKGSKICKCVCTCETQHMHSPPNAVELHE